MNGYVDTQFVQMPYPLEFDVNKEAKTVTVTSRTGQWTFREGRVITFGGLEQDAYCQFMIEKMYPNGMTLISAGTSVPKFHTFKTWFAPGTIFADVFVTTG